MLDDVKLLFIGVQIVQLGRLPQCAGTSSIVVLPWCVGPWCVGPVFALMPPPP